MNNSFITVSDVERLAKAGVTITFEAIKDKVLSDPMRLSSRTRSTYLWRRALLSRSC
jgi:hypothetical protein